MTCGLTCPNFRLLCLSNNVFGTLSINFGGIMALDVYLQIDGIKGESADSAHQGWIEVTSAHWGVTQPRSATASTGGGHSAER